MADNLGEAIVEIRADLSDLIRGLREARDTTEDATNDMGNNASNAAGKMGGLKGAMGTLGKVAAGAVVTGIAAAAAGMVAAGGAAIKLGADLQRQEAAFTTLTGSVEGAQEHMKELASFAKASPFSIAGINEASIKMQAFGFDSKEVVPILGSLGDAVSAVGGGEAELDGVATALGQIQAKGKLSTEELMQLTERGIPGFQILQDELGLTGEQLESSLRKGAIDADTAISALLSGMDKKFGGSMETINNTAAGAFDNFKETATGALALVGKAGLDSIQGELVSAFNAGSEVIEGFTDKLEANGGNIKQTFIDMIPKELRDFFENDLKPTFESVLDTVTRVAEDLAPLWEAMKETAESTMNLLKENFGSVFDEIIETVTFFVDQFNNFWDQWGSTIVEMAVNSWDNIKTVIQEAIDIVSNVIELAMNLITGDWEGAWENIKEILSSAMELINSTLDLAFENIFILMRDIFSKMIEETKTDFKNIGDTISNKWNEIKAKTSEVWASIVTAVKTKWDEFKSNTVNALGSVAGTVSSKFTEIKNNITNRIKEGITNAIGSFKTLVSEGASKVGSLASTIATKAKEMANSFGSAFKNAISSGIKAALNALISKVNGAINNINTMIKNFNAVSPVDAPTIPTIAGLARGGTVLGQGLALIGERGPELLELPRGARVMPLNGGERQASQMTNRGGIGSGAQIINNIETIASPELIQLVVERALRKVALNTEFSI